MADRVGFEPTEPCGPSVFKTDGLNHSPTFPILAAWAGFEPATKWLTVTCATAAPPRNKNYLATRGISIPRSWSNTDIRASRYRPNSFVSTRIHQLSNFQYHSLLQLITDSGKPTSTYSIARTLRALVYPWRDNYYLYKDTQLDNNAHVGNSIQAWQQCHVSMKRQLELSFYPAGNHLFSHLAQVPVRGCSYTLGTASSLNIANLQINVNNYLTNKKAALVS